MQTSGRGNDSLMILLVIGVSMGIGTILFGGPADTLKAIDALMGDVFRGALQAVSAWF